MRPPQRFWGIFARKERWGLSWRGWLVLFAAVLGAFPLFLFRIYPFLAVTQPAHADILVIEGWIHEYAIRAGAAEFKTNLYHQVFSTGGPVSGNGIYVNDFQTSASSGVERLKVNGIPGELLQMVPSRVIGRDRTYNAAVALRDWFSAHKIHTRCVNVVTEDLHARRTRLLFQKALGEEVLVGIIAIPNPDYDSKHWWQYSEGVKDVISEGAAYVYARLFFHPWVSQQGDKTAAASQSNSIP